MFTNKLYQLKNDKKKQIIIGCQDPLTFNQIISICCEIKQRSREIED